MIQSTGRSGAAACSPAACPSARCSAARSTATARRHRLAIGPAINSRRSPAWSPGRPGTAAHARTGAGSAPSPRVRLCAPSRQCAAEKRGSRSTCSASAWRVSTQAPPKKIPLQWIGRHGAARHSRMGIGRAGLQHGPRSSRASAGSCSAWPSTASSRATSSGRCAADSVMRSRAVPPARWAGGSPAPQPGLAQPSASAAARWLSPISSGWIAAVSGLWQRPAAARMRRQQRRQPSRSAGYDAFSARAPRRPPARWMISRLACVASASAGGAGGGVARPRSAAATDDDRIGHHEGRRPRRRPCPACPSDQPAPAAEKKKCVRLPRLASPSTPRPCASSTTSQASWRSAKSRSSGAIAVHAEDAVGDDQLHGVARTRQHRLQPVDAWLCG